MTKPSLLKVAGRSLFFYAIDMAIAMCGFIFGFGLEVKSWPALICFLIMSRWPAKGQPQPQQAKGLAGHSTGANG